MLSLKLHSAPNFQRKNLASNLLIGVLSFCIYTCMYALRKPYTALIFNQELWGYPLKGFLVISQLLGYTLSKIVGIRFMGNLKRNHRLKTLIILLGVALIPLLGLPYLPYHWWPFLLLINGFPLGLIWGIVFSYVEGRNLTELIGAMLACTFIFSSGWVKSIALQFQTFGISLVWIPFLIGLIFYVPAIFLSIWLNRLPEPSKEEKQANSNRKSLSKTERWKFVKSNGWFILCVLLMYGSLTLLRDIRDNFGAEILSLLHIYNPTTFSQLETMITIFMLILIPLVSTIRNHFHALFTSIIVCFIGGFICMGSSISLNLDIINAVQFMILSGAGLYLGYILINISVMDRLIAWNKTEGTAGFLMYMADSTGYFFSLGVSSIAIFYNKGNIDWLNIFKLLLQGGGLFIVLISIITMILLIKQKKTLNLFNHE